MCSVNAKMVQGEVQQLKEAQTVGINGVMQ